jgi:hypothetical protein
VEEEKKRRILWEKVEALTGGKKISFTAHERRRLAEAGKLLTPEERRKCCQIVKPATILAWFRQLAARKYDSSQARRGRPPKPKDVRRLVVEMAMANPCGSPSPRPEACSSVGERTNPQRR